MAQIGRPPSAKTLAKRFTSAKVLESVDQGEMWRKFLESDDERISLDAWKYLNDRVHGKPHQALDLNHSGEVAIKRVVADL